jgi:hypothetical protein
MNWEAAGAIAEIIGTFGVIISLVYLGVQIRGQTVEANLASGIEMANQINSVYTDLSTDRALAAIWLKGLRDFGSLDEPEKVQFSALLSRFMRMIEAMFNQHQQHRFDDKVWTGLNEALKDICRYPGLQSWWGIREHWYNKEFRAHVASQIDLKESPRLYDEGPTGEV